MSTTSMMMMILMTTIDPDTTAATSVIRAASSPPPVIQTITATALHCSLCGCRSCPDVPNIQVGVSDTQKKLKGNIRQ